jgi:protein-L-isoaspartate(D-aspartate) O-methyltransferase
MCLLVRASVVGLVLGMTAVAAAAGSEFEAQRRQMVSDVASMVRSTAGETGLGRLSTPVLEALGRVPRHRFVPEQAVRSAYRNRPLSIGDGQTISQPYIVALSTELLEPKPEHVVLEVGTGSGYQSAILAELVDRVYSVEIIEPLGREAAERLAELGYRGIEVRIGDGYRGWPEQGPFDGIVVTAAAPHVPAPLLEQLKPGGRMVIPVGEHHGHQELLLIVKAADGAVRTRSVIPVRFVPLTGAGIQDQPQGR